MLRQWRTSSPSVHGPAARFDQRDGGDTARISGVAPSSCPAPLGLLLLLIPFVALLYPPFYAGLTPRLAGIPFFIWYQFLWVVIGVSITGVVYAIDRISERAP